jgi:hypothetical protein
MSGAFDPYHVWLGIQPHEQPANHYRLLGISVFESDHDVIDHAADRQMAHVRTFQSGKHGPRSQQLLNELASARVCLLNADKKAAYDDQLRSTLSGVLKAVPMAAPVAMAIPRADPVAAPVRAAPATLSPPTRASAGRAQPATVIGLAPDKTPLGTVAPPELAPLTDQLEQEVFAGEAPQAKYQIQKKRRRRGTGWKSPAALGIMAGVVVVCFFLLFGLARRLMQSSDWKSILFEGIPAPVESPESPPPETPPQ